jgi:hypothetical protein
VPNDRPNHGSLERYPIGALFAVWLYITSWPGRWLLVGNINVILKCLLCIVEELGCNEVCQKPSW